MHTSDRPVIVVGAGGHAIVLIEVLRKLGRHVLSITDSSANLQGQTIGGIKIEGSDEIVLEHDPSHVELANAIGSIGVPETRRRIFMKFASKGYRFATIVHPSAIVSPSAKLAQGAQVMAGATIQSRAIIGANAIINTNASIDHDCAIGMHTHIAPGVILSGNVSVGQCCHIGTAASVIQSVSLGAYSFAAAGAVITKDVPRNAAVRGLPAREFS